MIFRLSNVAPIKSFSVECQINTVRYNRILHMTPQILTINRVFYSQKISYTLSSKARYEVFIVSILEEIDCFERDFM